MNKMRPPSREFNILKLDQLQWLPNRSDFTSIYNIDTELDLCRIIRGFHGAFATGVAWQQGTLTLPDTWIRAFLRLAYALIVESSFPKFADIFLTFIIEYRSVHSRFCLACSPGYLPYFGLAYTASYFVKIIWCSCWFCNPPPLFWCWILLILRSPKGGCCSISDDLSCSCICSNIEISLSWTCHVFGL